MRTEIYEFGSENYEELRDIWEKSVRATHDFLEEKDILDIKEKIFTYFSYVDIFGMKNEEGKITGFIGLSEDKIEMLFVAPEYFGKSIGKKLVSFAVKDMGIYLVDVNEQNPKAFEFYKKIGAVIVSRDETDSEGNPFPILHLEFRA